MPIHSVKRDYFYPMAAYFAAGIALLPWYRHQIDPDGISYISIAQKYARGEIRDAVNACWGPLYSWLQVPLIGAGIDPLLAFKITGLMIGAIVLAGCIAFCDICGMDGRLKAVFQTAAVFVVLSYVLTLMTPDVLVAGIVLAYVCVVAGDGYPSAGVRSGIICGILGAAAYLAKSYAFPFFAVHFSLISAWHGLETRDPASKSGIRKNWRAGMAVFFLLSGLWAGVISYKYGYVTLGTAGRYNFARTGPAFGSQGYSTQTRGQSMLYDGFLNLPNRTAVNSFEDPSLYDRKLWNPGTHFRHYVRVVFCNALETVRAFLRFSILSPVILIVSLLLCVGSLRRRGLPAERRLVPVLLTMALWTAGFLLVVTEERYLRFDNFLLVCLAGVVLTALKNSRFKPAPFLYGMVVCITAGSFLVSPVRDMVSKFNAGKDIRAFSVLLDKQYGVKGPFASSRHWYLNLYLAYHLKAPYYGASNNRYDCAGLQREFERRGIKYFLSWDDSDESRCPFLEAIPSDRKSFLQNVMLEGAAHTVVVYRLE